MNMVITIQSIIICSILLWHHVISEHLPRISAEKHWEYKLFKSNMSVVIRPPLAPIITNPQLKLINVGAGETGTRAISEITDFLGLCPAIHYRGECKSQTIKTNYNDNTALSPNLHNQLKICGKSYRLESSCSVDFILNSISKYISTVATRFISIADTPISWLTPELVARVPNISMLISLRDPEDWTEHRLKNHPDDVICRYEYWEHRLVNHPFDLVGCIQLFSANETSSKALTMTYSIAETHGISMVAQAFDKMNKINARLVKRYQVLTVNLFGYGFNYNSFQRTKDRIAAFMNITIV